MKSVLFLCHGNICRSPMAEMIFRTMAGEGVTVESKAVSSEELGNPIDERARRTLEAHGIPVLPHYASRLTEEDYRDYDYLIVMERANLSRMRVPEKYKHKVFRILDFTDNPGDVEDPWYTGRFETVFRQIEAGCRGLAERLKNQ